MTTRKLDIDPSLSLTAHEMKAGSQAYEDWHWGIQPTRVLDWDDTDMPRVLVECGRLVRLHARAPRTGSRHPRRERDTMIEFSRSVSARSFIAYDPSHPDDRLYLLVAPQAQEVLRDRFWEQNNTESMPLTRLALLAGGRHSRRGDYPTVQVKPIGVCTAVVYFTEKKGDGPSYYIHKMGELTHHFPILAADERGRLWLAGGNYTAPSPGITD